MKPAAVTDDMVWDGAVKRTFIGPEDLPDCEPCEAIVERSQADPNVAVVRVPLELEPNEIIHLLAGGQVWLTMFGGICPFAVEVAPPSRSREN